MEYHENLSINEIVGRAFFEDCKAVGDVTSKAIFSEGQCGRAMIESKDIGVLSGVYLLEPLFHGIDPSLKIDIMSVDGFPLDFRTTICVLEGSLRSIFSGERIALNFLQRLSGIATATSKLVGLISHTPARLLDTRKTTPLLRTLEKRAVRDGGGLNHRFGLFDMALIKDTHIKASGGITQALTKARAFVRQMDMKDRMKIEVEVQTWDEFLEALSLVPDRIMLDNMTLDLMTACVKRARSEAPAVELEASGNIDEESIKKVAETGVDYISVGAITHSVKALDIHLIVV
jgi:nicotinate-nucleotide pyrophosphorylase (carboxylating)